MSMNIGATLLQVVQNDEERDVDEYHVARAESKGIR